MRNAKWLACVVAIGMTAMVARAGDGALRIGGGAHYWTTVDSIDAKNVDKDGFSWLASLQYKPSFVGFGADLEWKERGFAGSTKTVYEPQAYLILGSAIYGAAGVGGYYTDGEFADDPFYFFRVGLDLELLPSLHLDVHGIYRFENWDSLHNEATNIDTDTVTLGAAVRLAL